MTDIKQVLIDQAQIKFLNGDVAEFSAILKDLYYSHITCNCFLRDQPKELWKSLLNKAKSLKDDKGDFDLNFGKGFIFLMNKNEQEAFKYLTIAIELNPLSDICYSLRGTLDEKINLSKLNDSKEAVLLNPNARNYFVLASAYDDKNSRNVLTYLEKAISLNGKFACAYYNMALEYRSLNDYQSAVSSYLKCIAIEKNHWCYYGLWYCLDELNDYEKALQFIQEGHKQHPEELGYYFPLGVANARLKKHKEAIEFYNLHLIHNPDCEATKTNLRISTAINANNLVGIAISEYLQSNFTNSLNSFKEYLKLGNELSYENLITYFKVTLKCKDPNIEFGVLNPHYSRLSALKDSYLDKISKGETVTEAETNISKLMTYRSHYKIGFGNYDNSTIQEIINTDSYYIIWCIINLLHFSINPTLFLQESFKNEIDYLDALEINLVKIELVDIWTDKDDAQDYKAYNYSSQGFAGYSDFYSYDDDTLYSAFEGDPENYWNID